MFFFLYLCRPNRFNLSIMNSVFSFGLYFKPLIYCFRKKNRTASYCLVNRLREEIELTRLQCKASTNKNKITAVNTLDRFIREKELDYLTVGSITADHIKAFERWALDEGFKPNYVALHMRCMRALFNHINGRGKELFKHVRTTNSQTEKRAVDEQIIKTLREMDLSHEHKLNLARNIFLFTFDCMGMPLIDAVMLKKSQIKGDRIVYRRQKTGRMIEVVLCPHILELINKLPDTQTPYLLPAITTIDSGVSYQQYKRFYQQYMRSLAKISERLGIGYRLTSYTVRHSWASIAYKYDVDVNVIARAYGHANANVTYSYIKEISCTQLDLAEKRVFQATT